MLTISAGLPDLQILNLDSMLQIMQDMQTLRVEQLLLMNFKVFSPTQISGRTIVEFTD